MPREVNIAIIQQGPNSPDKKENLRKQEKLIDEATKEGKVDFIVFPELSTTQFFAVGLGDEGYLDWAEKVPGHSTEVIGKKAKEHRCHVLLGLLEKGQNEGEYFNSVALIGPDGKTIEGTLEDGTRFPAARKNFLGTIKVAERHTDEKLYFRPGPGMLIFDTKIAKVGIIICYDRWHPESYRVLAVRGAEIIFISVVSAGFVSELWTMGLRVHAAENELFVVGCNKGGVEKVKDVENRYYGMSCIVGPDGRVIEQAPEGEPAIIKAKIDLDEIKAARRRIQIYRDRRPELYHAITKIR